MPAHTALHNTIGTLTVSISYNVSGILLKFCTNIGNVITNCPSMSVTAVTNFMS